MMIYEPYNKKYGTTFGKLHSARDFRLYPRSKPIITAPEIQVSEIEIPGRDGRIDMTEALDGIPHYFNRTGTFEFTCFDRKNWTNVYHKLQNSLHGKRMSVVLDEDANWFYVGRLTVAEPEYNSQTGEAFFTIEADLEPFKYSTAGTLGDWLWDPFSFPNGIIRNYHHIQINTTNKAATVSGLKIPANTIRKKCLTFEAPNDSKTRWQTYKNTKNLTIYGATMPTVPNIILLAGFLSMTYTNNNGTVKTKTLSYGENLIDDLVLNTEDPVVLTFSGTGIIQVAIDLGSL